MKDVWRRVDDLYFKPLFGGSGAGDEARRPVVVEHEMTARRAVESADEEADVVTPTWRGGGTRGGGTSPKSPPKSPTIGGVRGPGGVNPFKELRLDGRPASSAIV